MILISAASLLDDLRVLRCRLADHSEYLGMWSSDDMQWALARLETMIERIELCHVVPSGEVRDGS